jgi:hypothetical protein
MVEYLTYMLLLRLSGTRDGYRAAYLQFSPFYRRDESIYATSQIVFSLNGSTVVADGPHRGRTGFNVPSMLRPSSLESPCVIAGLFTRWESLEGGVYPRPRPRVKT